MARRWRAKGAQLLRNHEAHARDDLPFPLGLAGPHDRRVSVASRRDPRPGGAAGPALAPIATIFATAFLLHIFACLRTFGFVQYAVTVLVKFRDQLDSLPTSGAPPAPPSAPPAIPTASPRRRPLGPAAKSRWPVAAKRLAGGFTLVFVQFTVAVLVEALQHFALQPFAVRALPPAWPTGWLAKGHRGR